MSNGEIERLKQKHEEQNRKEVNNYNRSMESAISRGKSGLTEDCRSSYQRCDGQLRVKKARNCLAKMAKSREIQTLDSAQLNRIFVLIVCHC